ncbi:hypothetical protein WJR50_06285 [Catalinimonas sp. 4WD22]|uniref:hypothetical protein n=1 Tax=Catalinimonas locisalis TaxID=3133978 RepID=UPI0031016366
MKTKIWGERSSLWRIIFRLKNAYQMFFLIKRRNKTYWLQRIADRNANAFYDY